MAGKQVILTQEGLEKLEQELEELKSVKRKEIAEKIKVALSFGDLSENSEYDEAKNEQAITRAQARRTFTIIKLSVPTRRTRFPATSPMNLPLARRCWAIVLAT